MWKEIITQKDIKKLMLEYGYFHDACIKEIKYTSGNYVNSDLVMKLYNNEKLHIIFQRQYKDPTAIEIEFSEIQTLHFVSNSKDGIIYGASLLFKNGSFYWGDSDNIENFQNYKGTWICSNKVKWRVVDEYIGNKDIY